MSKDNKTITLRELPELNKINDNDIFLITDGNKTHKITGKNLIQYMKSHDDIADYFVHQDTVGSVNGVAPLDGNKKILSENIPFGSQAGAVYEGASGKALEMEVGTKADKTELASHVTNQASHITSTERSNWNDSNAKKHTHSNKTALDEITAPLITDWNNAAAHISESAKHITDKERALWNTVNDKVTRVDGKALSSNDFSNAEKAKLQGIASGANLYQHPDADGSRHIPANGTTNGGKYLKATSTAGSYKWGTLTKADVESALGYTPSGSESVTYALSKSGSNIILTGSDGSKTSIPDSDTTYTLSDFGITSSSAEINQLKGVKSNVQTQLNNVYTKNEANTLLNDKLAKAGDGSNLTTAFTEAPTLAAINTGEKLSVIMGKIKKAITSLISHTGTAATASVSGHVKVDSALSSASTNPVQNKTVNAALAGKLSTAGDASSTTVAYNEVAALTELASGEKQSVAFGKLKLAVKNVMSIVKLLGSTDISAIGGGTVTGALAAINSNLFNKTTGFKGILNATEINDATITVSYTGNINSATADELGLAHGWWAVAHMAHVSGDGYCAQIAYPYTAADIPRYRSCRAGKWTQWTYFDGGLHAHIHPSTNIVSGTWLAGLYMAGWGLIVQISSCYQLQNLSVNNASVFVSGTGWKALPTPSISLSYQTYIIGYNVSGMGLTDGMAYIVTFDAKTT